MDEKTVIVGTKSFGVYIKAVMTKIEKDKEVTIKTRGKHISSAVSIAEYLVRTKNLQFGDIKISSEKFTGEDKKERTVPEISITIKTKEEVK